MKTLAITVVIGSIIILLACLFSGCSLLCKPIQNPVITIPPTPGTQLWNAAKKSNWLVTLSILGVAGGLFALANGSIKLGLSTMTASATSLFMALAVARYAAWMAVFGLIGSVAAVLFSILVRRKALVEIITGVQEYRENEASSGALTEVLDDNQSSTTKTIVANVKTGLKLAGVI